MTRLTKLAAGDIEYLAANLRPSDVAELEALGRSPLDALSMAARSDGWVQTFRAPDDTPLAIFGCSPFPDRDETGIPWMLGTPGVGRYSASFIKHSREVVSRMNTEYPSLMNMVDSRNIVSITYLRRLGFTIDTATPILAPSGVPFYVFTRHVG